MRNAVGQIKRNFVYEAPSPRLARLNGLHYGMSCRMEVLGSVPVFRRIAAADMPTSKAYSKVHPRVARFDTIFTNPPFSPEILRLP